VAGPNRFTAETWRGAMKIDGGCHCGRITYEAEVGPEAA
jgi:hypothetical protein